MDWLEVAIETTADGSETAAQVLYEAGANGIAMEGGAAEPVKNDEIKYDKAYADLVKIKAYFEEDARLSGRLSHIEKRLETLKNSDIGINLGTLDIRQKKVKDEDWENSWKKYYKPFKAGRKIVIKPTWEEYGKKRGEIVIELDPGMAFGTGMHETTKMCALYLEEYIKKGDIVIDVGCGSGILAIAACKLNAAHVYAFDNDPSCIKTAKENILNNNCKAITDLIVSDLLDDAKGIKADIITANLTAELLIRLNNKAKKCLKPNGIYIVSGIIAGREKEAEASFISSGFCVINKRTMGEWRAYALKEH